MRPAPEKMIDHTLLQPDATNADIERLCDEATEYGFMAVCVNPVHVERCVAMLAGSGVRVATVAGFPFGANRTQAKTVEATSAVALGAEEIDMVITIGALRSGENDHVAHDIRTVRKACAAGIILRVIIETCYLDDTQKRTACQIAMAEGADFVKTSTGLGPAGATPEDVRLMREMVGPEMGVKAAGGIRDAATFWTMVRAGANRIGTSAGVQIIDEIRSGGSDG